MGLQSLRIAAITSVLVALIGFAVAWRDSRTPPVQADDPAQREWVRTKDGWERPVWRTASHRPRLHPGLVAAFMTLTSLGCLVAASPSRSSIATPNATGASSTPGETEAFLNGEMREPPLWRPRVVHFEETPG